MNPLLRFFDFLGWVEGVPTSESAMTTDNTPKNLLEELAKAMAEALTKVAASQQAMAEALAKVTEAPKPPPEPTSGELNDRLAAQTRRGSFGRRLARRRREQVMDDDDGSGAGNLGSGSALRPTRRRR